MNQSKCNDVVASQQLQGTLIHSEVDVNTGIKPCQGTISSAGSGPIVIPDVPGSVDEVLETVFGLFAFECCV
jgi:hypothetical protein